jgi:uncharacterized membrane protein YesL
MFLLTNFWTEFKKDLYEWANSQGINLVYPFTIILIYFSYRSFNKLNNWDKLDISDKLLTIMLWVITGQAIIASIFNILWYLHIL